MWNEDQVMTFESFIDPPLISLFPQTLWGFLNSSQPSGKCCCSVVSFISLKSLSKSFLRSVFYVTFCVWGVWSVALSTLQPGTWQSATVSELWLVLCSAPSVPQPVFTITEKAPTRAFSWLKAPSSAFTILRHFTKRAKLSWGTGGFKTLC